MSIQHLRLFSIVLIVLFVTGCKTEDTHSMLIKPDLNNAETLEISSPSLNTIELESSGLGSIKQIAVRDSVILICAQNMVVSNSVNTGNRISTYSRKGRANHEYLSAWSVGFEDNMVYLFDMNAKKVMYFDLIGNILAQKYLPLTASGNPFQQFISYKDGMYIGQRVYGVGDIPELALYDSALVYVSDISDFNLRSGTSIGYRFHKNYKGEVLFNRSFLNEIYLVTDKEAGVAYIVDFEEYGIQNLHKFKDEVEIIEYIRNNNKVASMISNIYESKEYICFMYGFENDKYFCVYNKETDEAKSYLINKGTSTILQVMFDNNMVYIFHESENGDLFMSKTSVNNIWH